MQTEWLALLPLIILAAGGSVIFGIGAFWHQVPTALLFGLAVFTCLASGGTALLFPNVASNLSGLLAMDAYSSFYTVLFTIITLITLLLSYQYARQRAFAGDEFLGIILFASAGMVLIAASCHWLFFFLGLEMVSISLYVLIAIRRGDGPGIEAALKYFVMGAVASAFVVFGIAMLYGATGTLVIMKSLDLAGHPDNRFLLLFGLSLILVGLCFKISLVPFHLWTPDVYQGAPAPITAFLATGTKVALLSMFVRLALYGGDGAGALFAPALWTMASLTMVVGNITALAQTRVKRLLAYSSIAQMGYMMMALLAFKHTGVAAVIFYSVVYAFMDLGAFGTVGLLSPKESDRDVIADYQGLGYAQPGKAALLTLCLFSLAGLPATAGFIGKFMLFRAALEANLVGLALIGILTAIISLYFYLNIVVVLYMRPAEKKPTSAITGNEASLACFLIALIIFWLGLFPSSILSLIEKIVA
ncbi:MAG: NADH-quinone oxidoreductase subunit N [Desulfocapsaceae bacterium]|nr:NADH-quinone oxidoreductase subunit N [Desulfocapsaceae bacterium]